jgi:hypothetical protein
MVELKFTSVTSRIRILALVWLFVFLAACAPQTPVMLDSGIEGQVLIGPICPVVREGMDCADKPYQATITVRTSSGKDVTRFQTAADGKFRLPLAPGEYILHPETPQGKPLPRAAEQPFTVQAGIFANLTVNYDSGIR